MSVYNVVNGRLQNFFLPLFGELRYGTLLLIVVPQVVAVYA